MKPGAITRLRLEHQGLTRPRFDKPEHVAAWFGAVQAQDYLGALWALGQRTRGATEADVEDAEARRAIIRTWPMRGTLHFVAAADARWLTRLLAPRIIARNAARWKRDFGVDAKLLARADEVIARALEGGKRLPREALYEAMESRRIRTGDSRGLHLLLGLALRGRLCLAGKMGKQHSFALLDEWLPQSRVLEGDEALAELARRYYTSHGPATQKDFMWWAGITARQAVVGLDGVRAHLSGADIDGTRYWWREPARRPATRQSSAPHVRLLPAFDEFTVAYHDRSLLVDGRAPASKMSLLSPAVLVDGRVAGTWKRRIDKQCVIVEPALSRKLSRAEDAALRASVSRYGEFLGLVARLAR
jgi:hypothetical protein